MFKIEKSLKSTLPKIQQNQNNAIPIVQFTIKEQPQLEYQQEDIKSILQAYFEQQSMISLNLVMKAMTIIIHNQNQQNIKNLSSILETSADKSQQIFLLVSCCIKKGINIFKILKKMTTKAKTIVLTNIFCQYLFSSKFQTKISVRDHLQLYFSEVLDHEKLYIEIGNDFMVRSTKLFEILKSIAIVKCKQQIFTSFISRILGFIVSKKKEQLCEILQRYFQKQEQTVFIMNLLIVNYPEIADILAPIIRQLLKIQTVLSLSRSTKDTQLQTIFRSARRQWLNQQNSINFWMILDKYFQNVATRPSIIDLAKDLNEDKQYNEFITKKYLYEYFKGNSFRINIENQWFQKLQKQHKKQMIGDLMKSLSSIAIKDNYFILVLNKSSYPIQWKSNVQEQKLEKTTILKDKMKPFLAFLQNLRKQYLSLGKKVQLVCLSLICLDKQTNKTYFYSLQDYENCIKSNTLIQNQFFTRDIPIVPKQQIKQKIHKRDNIVIEALIVKYFKKKQTKLVSQQIQKQLQIDRETCMKSLICLQRKGIIQKEDDEKFVYVP